jgi:hypothetical protein
MMGMNMLQFGSNIMLGGLMNANIFKITMYKLGIFRSLNDFKGKGHVNVPFIKISTQDPSPLRGIKSGGHDEIGMKVMFNLLNDFLS